MSEEKLANRMIIIIVLVVALLYFGPKACSSSGGGSFGTRTCQVCHKSFSDSSNYRCIAKTNMCNGCYGVFKAATGK